MGATPSITSVLSSFSTHHAQRCVITQWLCYPTRQSFWFTNCLLQLISLNSVTQCSAENGPLPLHWLCTFPLLPHPSESVQGFQHLSTSKDNYFAVCPERYATLQCSWLEETAWRKNVFRSSFEHDLPNFRSAQISGMTWYNDMGSHAALQRRDQHF